MEIKITLNEAFEDSKRVIDITFIETGNVYLGIIVPDALGKNAAYIDYLMDDCDLEEMRLHEGSMLLVRDKNTFENLSLSYEEITVAAYHVTQTGIEATL